MDQSLLGLLYMQDRLAATHDFHQLRIVGIAIKAVAFIEEDSGTTVSAVCMADKQLIRVTFPTLAPIPGAGAGWTFLLIFLSFNNPLALTCVLDETILQGNNVLDRLFKKHSWPDVWDIVILSDEDGQLFVCCLTRDGKIRVYPKSSNSSSFSADISDFIHEPSQHTITDAYIRNFNKFSPNFILLRLQMADYNKVSYDFKNVWSKILPFSVCCSGIQTLKTFLSPRISPRICTYSAFFSLMIKL